MTLRCFQLGVLDRRRLASTTRARVASAKRRSRATAEKPPHAGARFSASLALPSAAHSDYLSPVQIHPTRESSDLALAGMAVVLGGLLLQSGPVVAWGGALVLGLSVARALTRLGVSRVRAAGLEMLWRARRAQAHGRARYRAGAAGRAAQPSQHRRCAFAGCAPWPRRSSSVQVSPEADEVPANTRLCVTLIVRGLRVGRHGIHGLSLEVESGPSLFEVPLTFANPFGIEVMPAPYSVLVRSARGGRSRQQANEGRPGRLRGEGGELRELREHQSGDPFRRIAWKASARRGVLLVREYEKDERDVVWLVLDAAVDHWAGPPGESALDRAIDEVASVAIRHGTRRRSRGPGRRRHAHVVLREARARRRSHRASDRKAGAGDRLHGRRSQRSRRDRAVAARDRAHAAARSGAVGARARLRDRPHRAARREAAPARAVSGRGHASATPRERSLRRYLAAFGVSSPARVDPERVRVDVELIRLMERLRHQRARPSLDLHVVGRARRDQPPCPLALAGRAQTPRPDVEMGAAPAVARQLERRIAQSHGRARRLRHPSKARPRTRRALAASAGHPAGARSRRQARAQVSGHRSQGALRGLQPRTRGEHAVALWQLESLCAVP